jgi:tetratricopeptide (TPR) repeat protein
MEISRDPLKALWLGPVVQSQRRQALRSGQDNPRTLYLLGAAYLQGPGFLGGPKKGLPYLRRAEGLFEASAEGDEGAPASAPRWGHEHCVILIGQTYQESGDTQKAVEYFRKALDLNPQNKLARRCLDGLERGTTSNE